MALRTFHSNPALGGFGSESTVLWVRTSKKACPVNRDEAGDAFAQILKELVDNAVDACCSLTNNDTGESKRVRVTIDRYAQRTIEEDNCRKSSLMARSKEDKNDESDDDSVDYDESEILKVTVTDNGCGMESIHKCVNAFHTSKAHACKETKACEKDNQDDQKNKSVNTNTAGRYGIGLTLCLLHAQRLVPDSCASIQSATSQNSHWTHNLCVVDTEHDSVRCIREEKFSKKRVDESGTSVSVLVPGGSTARMAWPRVAEYFARFKLSVGLTCSLEVLASTLSRLPLLIRPSNENNRCKKQDISQVKNEESHYNCVFTDEEAESVPLLGQDVPPAAAEKKVSTNDECARFSVWKAAQIYLGRSILLKNVAHTVVPIRFEKKIKCGGPKLEVGIIVHEEEHEEEDGDKVEEEEQEMRAADESGKLVLIRMVNRIPLLDCSEAAACGLVQGIVTKKRMWRSFGLEVSSRTEPINKMKLPTFHIRDSDQVAPFFQKRVHEAFHDDSESEDQHSYAESLCEEDESESDRSTHVSRSKRKRVDRREILLPAKVRLANVLVILQIHANPALLPLPTLSKGRLPMDNSAIDSALECGLIQCLRQLQKTNPCLLLSSTELCAVERDVRYIPTVASALTSIALRSARLKSVCTPRIVKWSQGRELQDEEALENAEDLTGGVRVLTVLTQELLVKILETRLRFVLAVNEKDRGKNKDEGGETTNISDAHSADCLNGLGSSDVDDGSVTLDESASNHDRTETLKDDFHDWF